MSGMGMRVRLVKTLILSRLNEANESFLFEPLEHSSCQLLFGLLADTCRQHLTNSQSGKSIEVFLFVFDVGCLQPHLLM